MLYIKQTPHCEQVSNKNILIPIDLFYAILWPLCNLYIFNPVCRSEFV